MGGARHFKHLGLIPNLGGPRSMLPRRNIFSYVQYMQYFLNPFEITECQKICQLPEIMWEKSGSTTIQSNEWVPICGPVGAYIYWQRPLVALVIMRGTKEEFM